MYLSLGVPAVLPLGLTTVEAEGSRRLCMLGVTLQHPPTLVFAYQADGFALVGARAQDALSYAERFISFCGKRPSVTVELEQATLKLMGLGADPLIGLGVARALAWANSLPGSGTLKLARALALPHSYAVELWGFDRGGLLWVETTSESDGVPRVLRRHTVEHDIRQKDWVFVFHFPIVPSSTPGELSLQRRTDLLRAIPHLDLAGLDEASLSLETAVEEDRLASFADSLRAVIRINRAALEASGRPYPTASEEDREVLDLMLDEGAVFADRTPMGLGRFALIEGADPSLQMRTRMRTVLGFKRGTITATITDNEGVSEVVREEPIRMRFLRLDMEL